MNFKYLKTLLFEIKELASSQLLIVVILFVQVGIVTRGLGTTSYGQAVLVLALIAIIFRTLHARNSDVTLLMLKKYGERMFTLSLVYDLLIGVVCYLICLVLFQSGLNSLFGNYSMSISLNILLICRIFQTLSEISKTDFPVFLYSLTAFSTLLITTCGNFDGPGEKLNTFVN